MNPTKHMPLYISLTFIFLYLSDLQLQLTIAQDQVTYLNSYCGEGEGYDQGGERANNVDQLLSNLTSRSTSSKFYNLTSGEAPNQVYGLFLCNSYSTNEVCQDCITLAQGEIRLRCPSSFEAIVWYIECMLRYSNHPIFSINNDSLSYNGNTGGAKYRRFNQRLTNTFISLLSTATSENSSLASATTTVYLTTDITLNSYVDCTPDLSPSDCRKCLQSALSKLQTPGARYGVLLQPSCRLMYVFNDAEAVLPGKGLYIALGVISAVAAASLFSNAFLFLNRRKTTAMPTGLDKIESRENLSFELDAIKAATDNFAINNKLGQGGFGIVYVGTLADGKAVAVKRLSNVSGQGMREFKTEACLTAKLQHKNLVKLFGFCLERDEKLLVYEFVPNKSLDRYLFGPKRGAHLKWETRQKIIIGITRGLVYLHEDSRPKIIHRDLKPSNILLDGEMNPKIADFGMAKLFEVDQTQGNTSRVAGTFGYMAPEYATTGHFSIKSDIFSFGVLLLEIVSGKRNSFSDPDKQDENLLQYAWRLWDENTPFNLVDAAIGNDFSKDEVERCIHIGLLCVQEDPAKRPSSVSVLQIVNTQPITLPKPTPPPSQPFKAGKQAVSHVSSGAHAEYEITDLLPR